MRISDWSSDVCSSDLSMDTASGAATRVSNAMTQRQRIEVLRSFALCFRIFISSHLFMCMECRTHRRTARHHGCFVVAAVEPFQTLPCDRLDMPRFMQRNWNASANPTHLDECLPPKKGRAR